MIGSHVKRNLSEPVKSLPVDYGNSRFLEIQKCRREYKDFLRFVSFLCLTFVSLNVIVRIMGISEVNANIPAAILFSFAVVTELIVIICVSLSKGSISGNCILYLQRLGEKGDTVYFNYSEIKACEYAIGLQALALVYSLLMVLYHSYALTSTLRGNDPKFSMWLIPWLMINSLLLVLVFVSSCMISVGLAQSCSQLRKSDGSDSSFACEFVFGKNLRTSSKYLRTAEGTSWVIVLLWILLVVIGIVKLVKSRGNSAPSTF